MAEGDLEIRADGRRLRARRYAPRQAPDQPTIVLLHQGLGSVSQWRGFPEALAEASGCAVVGYDRFGHGGSDVLEGPRAEDFLEREAIRALPQVLEALAIERPILYGHSDGATIALLFAAAYPERPRAVISEAAHVFSEVHELGGLPAVIQEFETGGLRERLARHHGKKVEAMFYGWANHWTAPERRDWTMVERLPAIRCPVLVIQGERDEHGTIAQVEAIEAGAGGPVARYLVPNCGHSPHLEAPAAVVSQVAAFLAAAAG